MPVRPIWIRQNGKVSPLTPTLPNCWQGEVDCIVGPFSSKRVAETFAQSSVDFCLHNAVMDSVFASGDAWYIKVKALEFEPLIA